MIVEHRYLPDPKRDACICGERKERHKYKSSMVVEKLKNNIWGYEYVVDDLPFYTGEKSR